MKLDGCVARCNMSCAQPAVHLLGQVAGALGGVEDLIIKDGEVEGQAQADGVRRGQIHQGDVLRRDSTES